MSTEEVDKLLSAHSLAALPAGCLLEISSLTERDGQQGKYGVASYATTLPNGERRSGRVNLSTNIMAQPTVSAPCVLFYQGSKTSKNGRTFYDASAIKAPETCDKETLKSMADGLRQLSKRALIARMTTQSLESFPSNTVFLFKDLTKRRLRKDNEPALVVSYETEVGGETLEGNLIVPARVEGEIRECGNRGILIFRGRKTSQNGRVYNDVRVVNLEAMDEMNI